MWQYIVLGLIPGTSFQITYGEFLIAFSTIAASIPVIHHYHYVLLRKKARAIALELIAVHAY